MARKNKKAPASASASAGAALPARLAALGETTPLLQGGGNGGATAAAVLEEEEEEEEARRYCRRTLVVRHCFSSLLSRVWDFAIVLLLTVVGPQGSFALIASYGVAVNVVVAVLSPPLGRWVDRSDRLRAVVAVAAMQNVFTLLSGACFLVLLYAPGADGSGIGPTSWEWHALVGAVHLTGALNNTCYGLSNVIIERDWVVVIAKGNAPWLRRITAALKSIDLISDLVAPMVVSFLHFFSYGVLTAAICVGNMAMVCLQFAALHDIYQRVPELGKPASSPLSEPPFPPALGGARSSGGDGSGGQSQAQEGQPQQQPQPQQRRRERPPSSACPAALASLLDNAQIYARQRSFLPGLALAMLYLSVLTFHYTMIAYLMTRGLPVVWIGVLQGLSAAVGVLGTAAYSVLAARLGTTQAGLVALWSQVACLAVAVLALFPPSPMTTTGKAAAGEGGGAVDPSLVVFVAFVALSRFGLYAYDVAGAQLFQYLVEEKARAVVGGVQRTLESLFELATYLVVLAFPRPEHFPLLALGSALVVLAAALVFSSFACRQPVGPLIRQDPDEARPVEVRQISPILNRFQRLSTILSVGSSMLTDEDEAEAGGAGEARV